MWRLANLTEEVRELWSLGLNLFFSRHDRVNSEVELLT